MNTDAKKLIEFLRNENELIVSYSGKNDDNDHEMFNFYRNNAGEYAILLVGNNSTIVGGVVASREEADSEWAHIKEYAVDNKYEVLHV